MPVPPGEVKGGRGLRLRPRGRASGSERGGQKEFGPPPLPPLPPREGRVLWA